LSFFVTLNLRKNFRVFVILTINFVVFTSPAKNDCPDAHERDCTPGEPGHRKKRQVYRSPTFYDAVLGAGPQSGAVHFLQNNQNLYGGANKIS
jgi:hypothetical protein